MRKDTEATPDAVSPNVQENHDLYTIAIGTSNPDDENKAGKIDLIENLESSPCPAK